MMVMRTAQVMSFGLKNEEEHDVKQHTPKAQNQTMMANQKITLKQQCMSPSVVNVQSDAPHVAKMKRRLVSHAKAGAQGNC